MPKKTAGTTTPSQMRLGPEVLDKLDQIVAWYATDSGNREDRTGVVRQLIHAEYLRQTLAWRKPTKNPE